MAKAKNEWMVREHGVLEKLAENLWWVWGALPGMTLRRNMTVVRLASGELLIHNAIALNEAGMTQLEALGAPKYLIVPSGYHRLDAGSFKQRYPQLQVFAPRNARSKVGEVVAVEGAYEDFPVRDDLRFETPDALGGLEGVMFVRSSDGTTVVLNDAMFNMDKKKDLFGYLFTTLLGSAPGPRVSRLAKAAIIKNKKGFRADLERFAAIPGLAP